MHLSLNGEHNVNTYYSTVTDDEIDILFGSEAPDTGSVNKVITADPNGVTSVTYVGKSGQVIATCLNSGAALEANPRLDNIGNEEAIEVSSSMGSASFPEGSYVSSNSLSIVNDQPGNLSVELDYQITPASFSRTIGGNYQTPVTECRTCDYKVEIHIRNIETPDIAENNQVLTYTIQPEIDASCGASPVTYKVSAFQTKNPGLSVTASGDVVTLQLPTGSYVIERRIYANNTGMTVGMDGSNMPIISTQPLLDYYQAQMKEFAEDWTATDNLCGPFVSDTLVDDWECNEVPHFCNQTNPEQFLNGGIATLRD